MKECQPKGQEIYKKKDVLVVGGAGYVGSVLVPKLLKEGYKVRVFDNYTYSKTNELGADIFGDLIDHKSLEQIKGDVRDEKAIDEAVSEMTNVIHLACISNDPSFDLDRQLGKDVNYLSFFKFIKAINKYKTERLVYASSASVYGVKTEKEVTEELPLEPLTDYALYKAFCEKAIQDLISPENTSWVILRPSTVYGYGPRQRLDLVVNIMTNNALNRGEMRVDGGQQQRPNIHMDDVTSLYLLMLTLPKDKIAGKIYNAGNENLSVMQIAEIVQEIVGEVTGKEVTLNIQDTKDNRSYRVSSRKIREEIGWKPEKNIRDGIRELVQAFQDGKIPNPLSDSRYVNIKRLQELEENKK